MRYKGQSWYRTHIQRGGEGDWYKDYFSTEQGTGRKRSNMHCKKVGLFMNIPFT